MRKIGLMVLALAAAASASACGAQTPPASPVEVATTIDSAYRQALSLSPLRYEVENRHRYWTAAPENERSGEERYLEELQTRIRQDLKAAEVRTTPEDLSACVDVVLKGCGVTSAGFLSAGRDGRLWWQIQDGYTEEDGVGGGVVIFEDTTNDALKPIMWTFEGAQYETPFLERHGDGQWLLIVPGISRGTGSGDTTVMMLWRDGAWRAIDMDWQARARDMLGGMEVRHQPRWAFPRLVALTPLWRPRDANCCGEGGWVELEFDIVDDRLTLIEVEAIAPAAAS